MALEAVKENFEAPEAEGVTVIEDAKREQSTIQFPYASLEEAVAIAKGVNSVGGTHCQIDQLAAHLNQRPNTGSFRLKLSSTKLFGLITYSLGIVTLTQLGSRICDAQQDQAAKAEAFLLVPLYLRIYEQFKGAALPPAGGLEAAIVNMGVVQKQKSTARQVFQRSAQYAGFFWSGVGRLVYPSIKGSASAASVVDAPPTHADSGRDKEETGRLNRKNGDGGGDGGTGDYHPFIVGLLKTLPVADADWPMDARRKWLLAASHIFEVIYKDSDNKGSLKIEVQKDSAR